MAGSLFSDISNFVSGAAKQVSDFVKNELGFPTGGSGNYFSIGGELPWDENDRSAPFFPPQKIDPDRWNKLYPYRLLVVDVKKGNTIVGGERIQSVRGEYQVRRNPETGLEYLSYTQEPITGAWECVLPITPQQLTMQDQFAINTSATMRGIVEEHNGVKFKVISASGSTGIWARRPTRAGAIKSPSTLGSIFGGTLQAANNLVQGIQGVVSMFDGASNPNRTTDPETPALSDGGEFSTGYYHAHYLAQFLERYAEAKKNPRNKSWRLVVDMPKQNQSFVVTPVSFSLQQSQQKPNEITYNMQFKAWKRIDLRETIQPVSSDLPSLEANLFQRIIGTINQTRRVLSQATNLVKAVRGDIQGVFNVLRQTSLVVKDIGGFVFTVSDLPRNIVSDARSTIEDSLANISGAFSRPVSRGGSGRGNNVATTNVAVNPKGNINTPATLAGQAVNAILDKRSKNEGLTSEAVAAGALGSDAADSLAVDSTNNLFENQEENFELFNSLSVDDINLSVEQEEAFEDELENIRLVTIEDLRDFKNEIQTLALEISNNFGAGDGVFSSVYGRPDPKQRVASMTVEENEVLAALYEVVQAYDLLTATKQFDDLDIESPLEYVGGLANESGIDFDDFESKTLVPVPFGSTIEEIAARYMGDADKWIEISTLNSLRSPYIDEDGFFYEFLSNGEGRQFTVNNEEDRLYLGQKILLQSDTIPQFSRRIINIEEINETTTLVTVDGEDNLSSLTFSDNARMQGYLPGTVNSQNQIYIPVDIPSQEDDRTFEIPHLNDQTLTRISKVDFLLTEDNDVAINSLGDFRLANGLTNLIQALRMKVITERGTLLRHLDYGLGLSAGISVADIENGEIIKAMNDMVVADPRFSGIERITVNLNGSTLAIDMAVRVANDSGVIPITFDVRM